MSGREGKTLERQLPVDYLLERALLASIISEPGGMAEITRCTQPKDFVLPANRQIYAALLELYLGGAGLDVISLEMSLARAGKLDDVGGLAYISALWSDGLRAEEGVNYARRLRELARQRSYTEVGTRLAGLGYARLGEDGDFADAAALQAEADRLLLTLNDAATREEDVIGIAQAVDDLLNDMTTWADREQRIPGTSTGLPMLDNVTGGLQPGDLWIISAPTGGGKSTLLLHLMLAALRGDQRTLLLSLEMARSQIVMRALANLSGITVPALRAPGYLRAADYQVVLEQAGSLARLPLMLSARGGMTVADVAQRARWQKLRGGLDVLIVDYLQLMQAGRAGGSKTQEVDDIAYGLAGLAVELDVTVLAAAQLNREAIRGVSPDLWLNYHKWGSGIEQAASIAVSVYIPLEGEVDPPWERGLYVTKNRNMGIGYVPADWDRTLFRISERAQAGSDIEEATAWSRG